MTLTMDAVETVLELIARESLYDGDEHKFAVSKFDKASMHSTICRRPSAICSRGMVR
jgi:hypothetical protein